MKKVLLIAAAMFAAVLTTVGLAPPASAYPEVTCYLVVDPVNVKPGETITVTASLTVTDNGGRLNAARLTAAEDTTWTITFAGQTKTGSGSPFITHFVAPNVSSATTFQVHAESDNPDGTCERSVNVVVSPDSIVQPPPGDGLPNTGGPHLSILIGGLLLVGAGTYAVRKSRSRAV